MKIFLMRALGSALLLGAAACPCDTSLEPLLYQFSTSRSLNDRGQLWRHSNPDDFGIKAAESEPFPFHEATLKYLHPDNHDKINRVYDEHIALTLLDGSQCGFDLTVDSYYFAECECTAPDGSLFTGRLRTVGRLLEGKFVNDGERWGFEDLTPSES